MIIFKKIYNHLNKDFLIIIQGEFNFDLVFVMSVFKASHVANDNQFPHNLNKLKFIFELDKAG